MNDAHAPLKWCILIPCYNESRAIARVIEEAGKLGAPIFVIDDGSDDGTPDIVARLPVNLLRNTRRGGKGEALRMGFRHALAEGFDGAVTMDGDGQHHASDIPAMVQAAREYPRHIVVGARLINRERQPKARRRANDFADWGISWACGQRLVDTQSGQRYYPREALELADIEAEGFVFESDILIESARQRGVRVAAVPIESRYESSDQQSDMRHSHFRPLPDFLRITSHVVWKTATSGRLIRNYRAMHREPALLIGSVPDSLRSQPVRE